MKTERLIDALSSNLEPIQSGRLGRTLALAIIVGAIAAFCVMLATLGLREDFGDSAHLRFLALKLLFAGGLVATGAALLIHLMRPGRVGRGRLVFVLVPFIAISVAALAALAWEPAATWYVLFLGTQWATCLICIPLFAAIPFATLTWAVRNGAPTDLRRAGAIVGLVAGALGAAAYAFYCPDDSLPFIAIRYSAAIALCALIGAVFGPRLLRW
jgi:hypothetical protein